MVLGAIAAAVLYSTSYAAGIATEDPAAQAAYYTKQAVDLRANAEKHAKEAGVHRTGPGGSKMAHDSIVQHCEKIAANLRAAADESDALAQAYRDLAGQKK
jgi:hypothetical protein